MADSRLINLPIFSRVAALVSAFATPHVMGDEGNIA